VSEQPLVMVAGLADRRQTFEETNYWFETSRYIGVTIVNQIEMYGQISWVFLPLCFMGDVACLSEIMLCPMTSCLVLCWTTRALSGFVQPADMLTRWRW